VSCSPDDWQVAAAQSPSSRLDFVLVPRSKGDLRHHVLEQADLPTTYLVFPFFLYSYPFIVEALEFALWAIVLGNPLMPSLS